MNKIVNKFLVGGDKSMPEMHLKQLGFTYTAYGPFTRKNEDWKINAEWKYRLYLQKWQGCFEHDMAYGKFKDLAKRTQSEKVLRDKTFKIASNPKYDGYEYDDYL